MQASHVVVDTRDGHTWAKDAAGQLLTLDTARGMADRYNAECKPEHRTYAVYRLSLDTRYAAMAACTDVDCTMRGKVHTDPHMRADGAEYITVTPSPEMRAAVLAAAGIPDGQEV